MFLKLRVLFTILCALCLAAIIPVAVWGGWFWLAVVGGAALLFFAAMLLCKQSQERAEENAKEKDEAPDFIGEKNKK